MSRGAASSERLRREIEHHRDLAGRHTEEIWGWATPAGRRRADRRGELFVAVGEIRAGRRVLEIGCGTGEFTHRVARAGAQLTALDLSAELLAKARARVDRGARFVQGNAQELPFPTGAFDTVYGCSILHHLDPPAALAEVRRVLRPGGRLVFSEPNLLNPQVMVMFKVHRLRSYFGNSPDEMAFTPAYIAGVLRRLGFARFRVRHFDFLHPSIPAAFLGRLETALERLEAVPGVRALSGSLLIDAER
ncbi:MAG: methyltransferase domain-containing protein [Candidatus Rokuibacteriota bacterium]